MISFLQDNRQKVYWSLQAGGWGGYGFLNFLILFSVRSESPKPERLDSMMLVLLPSLFLIGIGVTHLFRYFIRKYDWLQLELKALAPRLTGGSFACAALIFIALSLPLYLTGMPVERLFSAPNIMINLINLSIIVLLWSLIYLDRKSVV